MRITISLLIVMGLATVGCTSNLFKGGGKTKTVTAGKPGDYVPREFVFAGEQAAVDTYLKENSIEAQYETLDAKDRIYRVKYQGDGKLDTIMTDLAPLVDWIEPNRVVQAISTMRKAEWPTDKLFFKQWALNNIGQAAPYGLPGVRGADMDILKTWDKVTKGSEKVVVAVIDTGCDYTHPDLKQNMWVNVKESEAGGGINGVDDDGNGYVDDVYGYDFVSSDKTASRPGTPGDPDPMDEDGHGTHCSGVIGATPNDGEGIAGINHKVKIMCIRFLGSQGGTSVDSFRALRYARENGANIMSNSWGGGDSSELFKSELRKAEEKGILFIAAAGNDGTNNDVKPHYPSNLGDTEFRGKKFKNVLSVGATDNQDTPADFSNYGSDSVDVFAPGVAIMSTFPVKLTAAGRPAYQTMSGTSMAAPQVAGVAALMMAANPSLVGQAAEVIRLINETADVKEQLIGKAKSNGRINAYKAVTAQLEGPKAPVIWQTKSQVIDQRRFQTELVDIRHEIKVDGAKSVKVHFDFIQIEEPYDSIYIYDKEYRLIARVEKNLVADFWSPAVPGDTMYVRFVNSMLQKVTLNPLKTSSEAQCVSRGGTNVEKQGSDYKCDVDSEDSSSNGGTKKYVSFNSEGFRIDQVAYVTERAN
jgi:subtilisin family serine protease